MKKKMIKKEILKSQDDYYRLLLNYKALIGHSTNMEEIAMVIDEIKIFWLKKIEILNYELDTLANSNQCFLLSGAVFLNIKENEHYYFKTLGEYHIISDPLLKLDPLFKMSENKIDINETIGYFQKAYNDTIMLLEKYQSEFLILPIRDVFWENKDEQLELLDTFFWKFISGIFSKEFGNFDEFNKEYETYEEIENGIIESVFENLIYTDSYDSELNLKERVERYLKIENNMSKLTDQMTETEIFLTITKSFISQIMDILLTSVSNDLIPYIRSEVTFRYLALIMYTFIKDEKLREMIEKTIIFYILHETIEKNKFSNVDFNFYSSKSKEYKLLQKIRNKINELNLDIFKCDTKRIEEIIINEMSILLKDI